MQVRQEALCLQRVQIAERLHWTSHQAFDQPLSFGHLAHSTCVK